MPLDHDRTLDALLEAEPRPAGDRALDRSSEHRLALQIALAQLLVAALAYLIFPLPDSPAPATDRSAVAIVGSQGAGEPRR